jgi:hypothetical protein
VTLSVALETADEAWRTTFVGAVSANVAEDCAEAGSSGTWVGARRARVALDWPDEAWSGTVVCAVSASVALDCALLA